eukprot:5198264-Amphidinium_carterae.1
MDPKDNHINSTARDNRVTTVTKPSTTIHRTINNNTTVEKKRHRKSMEPRWINKYNKGAGKKGESRPQVSRPQVFNIADNTAHWHQEPDHIQFQACGSTQQPLGTSSQPFQSQMGTLYNETLYPIGAVINVNEKTPTRNTKLWAIIIDTGAAVSVCPITFCEQVPITPTTEETKKHYVTVTGEGLKIQKWKETTLIIGTIVMQVCFIVGNVQSPLIGLPDLNDDKTTIHTGDKPYIEQSGHSEQLLHIGSHLHVVSMVLPGFHTPNEIQVDNTVNTRYSPMDATTFIVGDIESTINKPTYQDN